MGKVRLRSWHTPRPSRDSSSLWAVYTIFYTIRYALSQLPFLFWPTSVCKKVQSLSTKSCIRVRREFICRCRRFRILLLAMEANLTYRAGLSIYSSCTIKKFVIHEIPQATVYSIISSCYGQSVTSYSQPSMARYKYIEYIVSLMDISITKDKYRVLE
jgi:hypothetical protein